MELKEEIRVRGDDLQQVVEEAVRKALGGITKTEEGPSSRFIETNAGRYQERKASEDEIHPKESAHSILWHKEMESIAVNIKSKKGAVLFTSSVSGEGTTTVCSNVSRALAKVCSGNVLLMDCNVQNPEIHRLFNTGSSPGLIDILLGRINWEEAIRKSSLKNFFVLPLGQSLQEPMSRLVSEGMEKLLNALKTDFDFICLDTPPILGSAVAEMLAPWVEALVLVIKAQVTRREVIMRAVERMIPHKKFLGAVFNWQEFVIPQYLYKRLK